MKIESQARASDGILRQYGSVVLRGANGEYHLTFGNFLSSEEKKFVADTMMYSIPENYKYDPEETTRTDDHICMVYKPSLRLNTGQYHS